MRLAEGYVNVEKGVNTSEECTGTGAKDIIAETISDDAVMRRRLRMAAMGARALHEPRRKGRGFRISHVL